MHFEGFGSSENEFLCIPNTSEAPKTDFHAFRTLRKRRKWIFSLSESLGKTENGFLYIPSHSEVPKMNFYSFRVARKHRKWIFIHFERLGSTENGFSFLPSGSEAPKIAYLCPRIGIFLQGGEFFPVQARRNRGQKKEYFGLHHS